MKADIRKQSESRSDRVETAVSVRLAVFAGGLLLGIWGAYSLLTGGGSQSVAFYASAGWFVLLAMVYMALRNQDSLVWYSIPVLLTFEGLLEFVCIPIWRFVTGAAELDSVYVHAMAICLIGFSAFWIGSLISKREAGMRFVPKMRDTSAWVVFMSGAMLVLGILGNLLIWKLGLSLYLNTTDSAGLHNSYLPLMGWLTFCSSLLQAAMIVSAIEVLGKQSHAPLIGLIFGLSVVLMIGFGLISAMKSAPLFPLLYIMLIYRITRGRFPRTALVIPLLLLPIYPFVNAYRANLNTGYSAQANTLGGLEAVLGKSFADAFNSPLSTGNSAGSSFDQAGDRLNLLSDVHDIIGLPDSSLLNGDEKIWLAPIYPLVPRALWKNKPVFDKGVRLSITLGRGSLSSSAATQIGDLYSLFGTSGVVVGMLVYGLCVQLYMNRVSGALSERTLFFYISMLMPMINLEQDCVALIGTLVQTGITLLVVSYFIYGRPDSSTHIRMHLPSTSTI